MAFSDITKCLDIDAVHVILIKNKNSKYKFYKLCETFTIEHKKMEK